MWVDSGLNGSSHLLSFNGVYAKDNCGFLMSPRCISQIIRKLCYNPKRFQLSSFVFLSYLNLQEKLYLGTRTPVGSTITEVSLQVVTS